MADVNQYRCPACGRTYTGRISEPWHCGGQLDDGPKHDPVAVVRVDAKPKSPLAGPYWKLGFTAGKDGP